MKFNSSNGDHIETDNKKVIDFVKKCNLAGIAWRTYSGRGMYGKETVGVTVGFRSEYSLADLEDAGIRISGLRTDSMGLGTIYYIHL